MGRRGKGGGGKMMGSKWRVRLMILERLVVVVRIMGKFTNTFTASKWGDVAASG